jgi:hypothetical protein
MLEMDCFEVEDLLAGEKSSWEREVGGTFIFVVEGYTVWVEVSLHDTDSVEADCDHLSVFICHLPYFVPH